MKTVYIVTSYIDYEGEEIKAVYSTREKAELHEFDEYEYGTKVITEWKIK